MLKYCNYNWISLLDVDDKWLSTKLESQLVFMSDYDVIGTLCNYFGERSGSPDIPTGNITNFNFCSVNPVINSSCLLKKELCFWDSVWDSIEDYDVWLRLWKGGKRFYNVESIQVLHRIHKASAFNANGNHLLVDKLRQKYS
jgi:hypothetical protein